VLKEEKQMKKQTFSQQILQLTKMKTNFKSQFYKIIPTDLTQIPEIHNNQSQLN
jgi:hypothetical protein